jgi:hypothetical protein
MNLHYPGDYQHVTRKANRSLRARPRALLDATSDETRDRTDATRDANGLVPVVEPDARCPGAPRSAWAVDKVEFQQHQWARHRGSCEK